MKTESSIKENCLSTTVEPIKDVEKCIEIICEWNGITVSEFRNVVWEYRKLWVDEDWQPLYVHNETIIHPIGRYLWLTYQDKEVVFEKDKDKFFGEIRISSSLTRYMLGDKVIEIPFRIKAVNEDGTEIIIFPKKTDILKPRMKSMYVVNTGWAERQRLEKEIMAKLIELAQVNGWNEIISSQSMVEDLQKALKTRGIDMKLDSWCVYLDFGWRKIRDTDNNDREYIASPITVSIDFDNNRVECRWYSPHWFGTPNSWWNPCWWNLDNDIHHHLHECDLKWLINLIISWSNGYNSRDTGTSHSWRHPIAKLRDYMYWLYDNKTTREEEIKEAKKHIKEIKADLEEDNWKLQMKSEFHKHKFQG